jgi:hypothetical protein
MPIASIHTRDHSRDRESTILMIQWAIWKHLAPKIIMDSERMQRLAEDLAHSFYEDGLRMPLDDDDHETPLALTAELLVVSKELGPVPIPEKHLRERAREMGKRLYGRGWRRFVTAAAALIMWELSAGVLQAAMV